ncbi:methyltransferase domain-containing protein [Nonomuraea angiospora]|uniref:methyltransferase domain-containing protein n=1 Tax=Nonomuraea angiospora TaxID=46172 RepID=UPI0034493C5D
MKLVPEDCAHALDAGCGDGLLAGKLAARVPYVTGIDRSAEAIAMARERRPGNAKDRTLLDGIVRLSGQAVSHVLKLFHGGKRGPGVPAMDPVMSWDEVGRAARRLLPGCRFRRLLLRRYLLVWDKPR